MIKEIDELREFLRAHLDQHHLIHAVAPASDQSEQLHLSVYRTTSGEPIGVEYDKKTLLNIWARSGGGGIVTSSSIKETHKAWTGQMWESEDGKGANSNLSAYDDFHGYDIVRYAIETQQDAIAIINLITGRSPKKRYFLKVNGIEHCPNGICRPENGADWEGGEILIPAKGPIYATGGAHKSAHAIEAGDELWIWTHEDDLFGRGWGLTAKALAGKQMLKGEAIAVTLKDVERLARPFGFRDLGDGTTGSRTLDHVKNADRWWNAYLIDEDDYFSFRSVVDDRATELSEDIRHGYAVGWEREVLTHRDDMLAGLRERRVSTQKARTGQAQFRDALMTQHNGRCVVTKCPIPEALEAAHVMPHTGDPKWDHPDNGMILRRDLHALFDAMLWSIDPRSSKIRLAEKLKVSSYARLEGRKVDHRVARELLMVHYLQFEKRRSANE